MSFQHGVGYLLLCHSQDFWRLGNALAPTFPAIVVATKLSMNGERILFKCRPNRLYQHRRCN